MQRLPSSLLFILLGALVVGSGMGVFLHKANQDRTHLAEIATQAEIKAKRSEEAKERAIQEANKKLEAASAEVSKAELTLGRLEAERIQMAKATILYPPSARTVRDWKEAVALHMGVKLRYPPDTTNGPFESDEAIALRMKTNLALDTTWFFMQAYTQQNEQRLQNFMPLAASTSSVSSVVDQHLLTGIKGQLKGNDMIFFLFKVSFRGQTTHLIRANVPSSRVNILNTVLSTLDFAK